MDPEWRLSIITLLRKCAFHYEFTCASDPIVSCFYRVHGFAYIHTQITGAPDNHYVVLSHTTSPTALTTVVANIAQGLVTHTLRIGLSGGEPVRHSLYHYFYEFGKQRLTDGHLLAHVRVSEEWGSIITVFSINRDIIVATYDSVSEIGAVAFNYSGDGLMYGTKDGTLYLTVLTQVSSELRPQYLIVCMDGKIKKLGFHREGKLVYSTAVDEPGNHYCMLWALQDSQEASPLFVIPAVSLVKFHPVSNCILYRSSDWFKLAVTNETGHRLGETESSESWILEMTYSPCGNYILSSHAQPIHITIWNSKTLERLHTIEGIGGARLWFSEDKNELCLVGPDYRNQLHLINFEAERRHAGF